MALAEVEKRSAVAGMRVFSATIVVVVEFDRVLLLKRGGGG
jgi:hypothetical protein